MVAKIEIDQWVIDRVVSMSAIARDDTDYEKYLTYLKLRYLHYRRIAAIKGLAEAQFDAIIVSALQADLQRYRLDIFRLTAEEDARVVKQMQGKYHYLAQASAEEHAAAQRLVQQLPLIDQEVLGLLRDGLGQNDIAKVSGLGIQELWRISGELKEIYLEMKGRG